MTHARDIDLSTCPWQRFVMSSLQKAIPHLKANANTAAADVDTCQHLERDLSHSIVPRRPRAARTLPPSCSARSADCTSAQLSSRVSASATWPAHSCSMARHRSAEFPVASTRIDTERWCNFSLLATRQTMRLE